MNDSICAYDIGTYLVPSSRGGHHIVDAEEHTCSCEYFNDATKHPFAPTCRHLEAVLRELAKHTQ